MKRDDSSPEAYRDDVSGEQRTMLDRVRDLVFEVFPDAEETIQHSMLGYPGIANLAAQKDYVALYVKPEVLDDFRDRFGNCGKSCVRFRRPADIDRGDVLALLESLASSR